MKTECLRLVCFFIATGELLRSLYFVFCSTVWLTDEITLYVLASLVSSFLWVAIVMALFIGLLRYNMEFMKFWMLFAFIGFIVHDLYLIKGLVLGTLDWSGSQGTMLLIFGTVLDGASIYLVYYYCKTLTDKELEPMEPLLGDKKRVKHKQEKKIVPLKFTEEQELKSKKQNKRKKTQPKIKSKSKSKSQSQTRDRK